MDEVDPDTYGYGEGDRMLGAIGIETVVSLEEVLHAGFGIEADDRRETILQSDAQAYGPLY